MKKIAVVLIVLMFQTWILALDTTEDASGNTQTKQIEYEYNVYSHEDLSANVLMGWGGVSVVSGGVMAFSGNSFARGMGIQNMLWGGLDAGIGLWIKSTETERKGLRSKEEEEKWFRDMLGINFMLDFAYVAIGTSMLIWGNEEVKGHGAGILTQGVFLLTFDGVNWMVGSNLSERYK